MDTIAPEVVKAAARIVSEEGVAALTMQRLARATRLSRATLYRQCGGRGPLLEAVAAAGQDVGDRGATRERILRGAREVFGRVGFEAAAIEQVANAAGVGVASVYRYFGDKDGLVAAFLDELGPRRAAREAKHHASEDVRRDLEHLAEQMLTGMRDDAPLVRLLFLETLRGGPMVKRVRAKSPTRTMKTIAAVLRTHCEAGRLKQADPEFLAQTFGGMVLAFGVVAPLMRGAPAGDPAATARAIVELFLTGALPAEEVREWMR